MDDEQFKKKLRDVFFEDLNRQVAIDTLLKEADRKGLIKTPQDLDRPALLQFYRAIYPDTQASSQVEQEDPSNEAIAELMQRHASHISERREAIERCSEYRTYRKTWNEEAQPSNKVFLDVPRLVTTLSAIDDWSSTSEGPSSLQVQSQNALMEAIRKSLVGAKASAAFCWGGSLSFGDTSPESKSSDCIESGPVTIRWDNKATGSGKITFSQSSSTDPLFHEALNNLCLSSEPASFGRGGKTVFDASYRQATKLDATEFSTGFHPRDYGILADLERILLPSYLGDHYRVHRHSIFAELYKLNVYSGPGGLFKAHVDTPRSETQFASLVVCLPSAHEGGALVLRHNNRSTKFDWSGEAPNNIQWAAFYSDCEHEVMPLESGHRVTLTYNLYYQKTQSKPALPLRINSCPIYHDLQAALQTPGFMSRGGTLGFYCNHAYAHSHVKQRNYLPMALKGVDLLIYAVCRSLGLVTKTRPIMAFEDEGLCASYTGMDGWEGCDEEADLNAYKAARGRLRDFQKDGFHIAPYHRHHMKWLTADDEDYEPAPNNPSMRICSRYRNKTDDPTKHPLAQNELTLEYRRYDERLQLKQESCSPAEPEAKIKYLKSHAVVLGLEPPLTPHTVEVGSKFHALTVLKGQFEQGRGEIIKYWPSDMVAGIQWVTERKHSEVAMAYTAYGNEASSACEYSSAAILVIIPPWTPKRGDMGDGTATFSVATDDSDGKEDGKTGRPLDDD